ncbi:YHS domain-containing protein [Romeria aff. gracilis LEGE 07310]|uniref:YHS domain-containing protein n=1 Tax=Vasconcelosia minhoensis LEGE 07310 TaxID=915328 RepID=A0A8J7A8P3_9CYAN|nr:YHS domain-containing (seleno)protein [Romeria gracilis]MBE9076016.1 YHS domain-containing protein [Romeria aff. gracilis LEGE 07310]
MIPRLSLTQRSLAALLFLSLGTFACNKTSTRVFSSESAAEADVAAAADGVSAVAEPSEQTEPYVVYEEDGVAIKGADPVAYFTDAEYVPGSSEFTHDWEGVTWQFASAENRDRFASSPEQYAPQYGGFCAWAVSQGYIAPIDPEAWTVVDNRLYLNFNQKIQERWLKDVPDNIADADENWPDVLL